MTRSQVLSCTVVGAVLILLGLSPTGEDVGVSFFVEGRYDLGVADVFTGGEIGGQLSDDVNVFTRGLQAMAGITIPLVR